WWRRFEKQPEFHQVLIDRGADLLQQDAKMLDDLQFVSRFFDKKTGSKPLTKDELARITFEDIGDMNAAERTKRAAMGQQVFERGACTRCHTTATATTLLAPSLKGVGQQKTEYLIESVLYPSKIIKTGWEVENIELKSGKTLTGLV